MLQQSGDICRDNNNTTQERSHIFEGDEPLGAVPGWGAQLLSSARFAHSDEYVRCIGTHHGFQVVSYRSIVLRKEETLSLPGHVFVLKVL